MNEATLFTLAIFSAVFLVATIIAFALFGERRDKRFAARLRDVYAVETTDEDELLLREKYLKNLSPLEQRIENLPGMESVAHLAEQTGRIVPGYRIVVLCLLLALIATFLAWVILGKAAYAIIAFFVVAPLPVIKLIRERNERMKQFEEQLADALQIMSRAMRAGNPFNEALKFVADEMQDPIATEFGTAFSDINYGISVKAALASLLNRVPNISLAAVVTAILVQRETGGNLAEILEKIANVIYARFRFQRRLKTLTAEGRMSAIVLGLFPFFMAGLLMIASPDYLPMLLEDPLGIKIVYGALILMILGAIWIRKLVKMDF